MVRKLISVDESFNIPDSVNTREVNLPDNLTATALNATYAPVAGSAVDAAQSVETTKLDKAEAATKYAATNIPAMQKIGNGTDPNSVTTQDVKLLITANRTNPDNVIEQHLVGYSFYSGTPQAGVGTLQGGSCESAIYANGSADWGLS